MARMSNNWTSVPILAAVLIVVALMSMTDVVSATSDNLLRVLSGRKFKIDNIFPVDGTPACPDANPNTVAFHPSHWDRFQGNVTIVGNFDAANIGVCTIPPGEPYAETPNNIISYYIYGDLVLWRFPDRVGAASQFVFQQGTLSAIGLANEGTFYVSALTDIGSAY